MRYVSPLSAFSKEIVDKMLHSPHEKKLARKYLLAEIELSETKSIVINGNEMTKHDIILLFDELKDDEIWEAHIEVYKNKNLLYFLEQRAFPSHFDFAESLTLFSETAIRFISPYYKDAALFWLSCAFKERDLAIFNLFFYSRSEHILTEVDKINLYAEIEKIFLKYKEIDLLNEEVVNSHEKHLKIRRLVRKLRFDLFIAMLNTLPEEFTPFRDRFGKYVSDKLVYNLTAKNYFFGARAIIKKLLTLKCSPEIIAHFQKVKNEVNSHLINYVLMGTVGSIGGIIVMGFNAIFNPVAPQDSVKVNVDTIRMQKPSQKDSNKTVKYDSSQKIELSKKGKN